MREIHVAKALTAACVAALCAAGLSAAQTAPAPAPAPAAQSAGAAEPLPSASAIIGKYVEAIGGKAAWEKLTSRVSKGTFDMEQMGGEATEEIDSEAPNKQYTLTESPTFVVKRGFNGTVGWEDLPQTGLQQLSGDELASMKRFSDFYFPIKLEEYYPKMTVKGRVSEGGHSAYEIEATPAEGGPEQLYFDADSGLLLRHSLEIDGPNGKTPFDSTFEDYRTVDGIKLPFVVKQSMGDYAWTIKLTDVKHNVPIDESKFNMPKEDSTAAAPQN